MKTIMFQINFATALCMMWLSLVTINLIAQNTWKQKADFGGVARHAAAGFVIGNKAYIGTGTDDDLFFRDFWEWNGDTSSPNYNTWTQKADFPGSKRREAIGFSIGGKGYIGLGCCPFYKDLWEYDTLTDSWVKKADFPTGVRATGLAFSIGDKAYIGFGDGGGAEFENDLWEFDPAQNTYTQKTSCPGAGRTDAVAFSIGTKGYIGIGDDGTPPMLEDFWEYDQPTDSWTQKTDFPGGPRTTTASFSIPILGKGFIGMGDNDAGTLYSDFWEWDQATDSWRQMADFGGGNRTDEIGFSIGTKGYIGIGALGAPPNFNDFWEYSPDTSVGIFESEQNKLSVIFLPNPVSSSAVVKIVNTASEANLKLSIMDMLGRELKKYEIKNEKTEIIADDLPGGLYFYQLNNGKNILYNGKLIFQ